MIISLVGFRGSGKSSVAPLLAAQLGLEFVDADQEIERREQRAIQEIFADQGEDYFRKVEAETLQDLYQTDNMVVATGGGAVLNLQTQSLMRNKGVVIWLRADAITTLERLQKDQCDGSLRPALTELNLQQEVTTLLQQREPIYQAVSHFQVDTVTQTPEQIVESILRHLNDNHRDQQ